MPPSLVLPNSDERSDTSSVPVPGPSPNPNPAAPEEEVDPEACDEGASERLTDLPYADARSDRPFPSPNPTASSNSPSPLSPGALATRLRTWEVGVALRSRSELKDTGESVFDGRGGGALSVLPRGWCNGSRSNGRCLGAGACNTSASVLAVPPDLAIISFIASILNPARAGTISSSSVASSRSSLTLLFSFDGEFEREPTSVLAVSHWVEGPSNRSGRPSPPSSTPFPPELGPGRGEAVLDDEDFFVYQLVDGGLVTLLAF